MLRRERIVWGEVLFSEVFRRSAKKSEKNVNLYNIYYLYSLMFSVIFVAVFPAILALAGGGCVHSVSCAVLLFNLFVLFFFLIILPTQFWRHGWIVITSEYLIITIGDGKRILRKWRVNDVNKIVINLPRKALELRLNDNVIKLKREKLLKPPFCGTTSQSDSKKPWRRRV
jgi:hypothetical protein